MATPMGSQPMEIRQQRTRNEAAWGHNLDTQLLEVNMALQRDKAVWYKGNTASASMTSQELGEHEKKRSRTSYQGRVVLHTVSWN